jgi:tetratricopeptide (TPR) repeat protein
MFQLFGKKDSSCPVSEEKREWLEQCFLWLTGTFGKEKTRERRVLVPDVSDFPIQYTGHASAALDSLRIIALQMELDPEDIRLDVYKEGQSSIDMGGVFGGRYFLQGADGQKHSNGLYFGKKEDGKYHIGLEEKRLKDPVGLVATLAHELSHIKLLGEGRLEKNNEDLTDLTSVVFGLGIFNANAAFRTNSDYDSWSWSRSGYLSQMEWSYALALFAHLRGETDPSWAKYLTRNVKADLKRSLNFIASNPDKIYKKQFRKPKEELPESNDTWKEILEERKEKNFEGVVDKYKKLLAENGTPRQKKIVLNNLGYSLIQLKKYTEAIQYLDQAIGIDGKWDFPYNNRGYCELQLGDHDKAYLDIVKACDLNPFNAYAWRNLGAYYLKTGEPQKALVQLEEAEKIDPDTALINCYLSIAHEKTGNTDKALYYRQRSEQLEEHIDFVE